MLIIVFSLSLVQLKLGKKIEVAHLTCIYSAVLIKQCVDQAVVRSKCEVLMCSRLALSLLRYYT